MHIFTFADICAKLGAPVQNPRWSWCALSPDGKRAVFTLWTDMLDRTRYPILYHEDRASDTNPNRRGWSEIAYVVQHCLANRDTDILGVLTRAQQPIEYPRVREWVDARDLLTLKLDIDQLGYPWAEIVGRYALGPVAPKQDAGPGFPNTPVNAEC
jgi:hypothetical protein